jgi:preprotein translocase subunit SecE
VARDRKRAKQRRARRERGGAPTAPGGQAGGPEAGAEPAAGGAPVAAGGSAGDVVDRAQGAGSPGVGRVERADLPGALEHAGDVDEFDAALVRGAGGVPVDAGDGMPADVDGAGGAGDGVAAEAEHLSEREIEDEAEAEGDLSEDEIQEIAGSSGSGGRGGIATPEQASGAPQRGGNRAIGFLRASWAELQRVQWPDRRQVFQATAVVLGFVAIAGAYLGLADYVAKEVVEFILS